MSEHEHEEEGTYDLVMPFVVCASRGGPFGDEAFVAGCQFGELADRARGMRMGMTIRAMVDARLEPQVDLLAMRHRLTVTVERFDDHPTWVEVTLVDNANEPIR